MQRLLIDRSTLDLIVSDAQDFLTMLSQAGLHHAASMMLGVLDQLAVDRSHLSDAPEKDTGPG